MTVLYFYVQTLACFYGTVKKGTAGVVFLEFSAETLENSINQI